MRSSCALGLALALACTRPPARVARGVDAEQAHLRVMTYNVNFGLGGDLATLDAIAGGDADLVLLEEITPEWEVALRRDLAGLYPHMTFHHAPGAGGLAILARLPFEEKDLVPSPTGWFPALRLVAETPIGPVQVLVVHLHPPASDGGSYLSPSAYLEAPGWRRAEMEAFFAHLDPSLPTVVAGDFNETGDGRAVAYLEAHGLRSALPEFHPHAATWHWATSVGTLSAQFDHIVYDPRLDPLDARVLDAGRSDHLPVVADFVRAR